MRRVRYLPLILLLSLFACSVEGSGVSDDRADDIIASVKGNALSLEESDYDGLAYHSAQTGVLYNSYSSNRGTYYHSVRIANAQRTEKWAYLDDGKLVTVIRSPSSNAYAITENDDESFWDGLFTSVYNGVVAEISNYFDRLSAYLDGYTSSEEGSDRSLSFLSKGDGNLTVRAYLSSEDEAGERDESFYAYMDGGLPYEYNLSRKTVTYATSSAAETARNVSNVHKFAYGECQEERPDLEGLTEAESRVF
jgi:hypothetical protein